MFQQQFVGLGLWLLLGVAFCFGSAVLARSRGPRLLWSLWAVSVSALVGATVLTMRMTPFGQELSAGLLPYYFLLSLIGIPSAGSLVFAIWRAGRPSPRRLLVESLFTVVVFLALLPVAVIVAVLPDFLTLWAP